MLNIFGYWKPKNPSCIFLSFNHLIIFSHTSDFPPCREHLWDKSISHGFHDLQHCPVNVAWLKCLKVRESAFCMVFHVKWISHHLSPNPTLVASDSDGIRRLVVRKIHLTWKTIHNSYQLHMSWSTTCKNILFNLQIRPIHIHVTIISLSILQAHLTNRNIQWLRGLFSFRLGDQLPGSYEAWT